MIGLAVGWAVVLAMVSAWSIVRRSRARTLPEVTARALVVRPCAGDEPALPRCLLSSPRAAAPPRTVFAIESPADAAWPIAEDACAKLRAGGVDAAIVATGARGPNRKADQLARAMAAEAADAEIVVVVDSDVDLDGFDLDALLAPFARADVAATWAPTVEVAPRTLGDRASVAVLSGSLHAFPLLAQLDPRGMVGKVMALRASCLREVGGFESLVDRLGEDMELARRFAARGWRVEPTRAAARSRAGGRTLRDVVRRYARWIAVIREQRPALLVSYPLLFTASPLVAALALASRSPLAPFVVGAVAGVRLAVAVAARARAGLRVSLLGAVLDALVADAVLAAAFAHALVTRDVTWRAHTLRFDRRGRLLGDA